jgi:hypothetical protein
MRDHNESHETCDDDERPNFPAMSADNDAEAGAAPSFTPWAGDNFEEHSEEPCLAA